MIAKTVVTVLLPGIGAGGAGGITLLLGGDAWLSTLAAGVGAVAGGLLQDPDTLPGTQPGRRGPIGAPSRRTGRGSAGAARPSHAHGPGALAEASAVVDTAADAATAGAGRDEAAMTPEGLPFGYGRILLERMPLGIVLVSAGRMVSFINPAGRALFGRVADGPIAIESLRAPRLLATVDEVRRTHTPAEADIVLQRQGTIHLTAHAVPLRVGRAETESAEGEEGAPDVLIALEDRTQARQTEALHRDFVANASHELKTPLSVVSGLIETLLGHGRDDPEAQARFLPMMAQQTERMRSLVEDLLSLNRIELNERLRPSEAQPVTQIVGEVVEHLRPMAERDNLAIVMAGADDPAMRALRVAGVREELAQAFGNLIENAIRYGRPAAAATTVSAGTSIGATKAAWSDDRPRDGQARGAGDDDGVEPRRGEVRVMMLRGSGPRRGHVGIAIEDDGPGIAREHLPRLTERFYRVSVSRSRERGGTGLGLAIVKHILNRHRGHLEIDSTPGTGSRFTAWLPLS